MESVTIQRGSGPIVLGFPHTGTWLPEEIQLKLNDNGRLLADTDWHVDRLYHGLLEGVTTIRANFHRYVIDANRDPTGKSLYPGQNTTGLVPETDFDGQSIWHDDIEEDRVEKLINSFHAPYHQAVSDELSRVHKEHGIAIFYDCHSIRSVIPNLFEGKLPDFNIGTNDGKSCAPEIERCVRDICFNADTYTHVLNGRFKGGWSTRHHGNPGKNIHAIQMELAQSTHLTREKPPFDYDAPKAKLLRKYLGKILGSLNQLAPSLRRPK